MRRPDFIIAGTQKAGTTWLRENLYARPDITGSPKQLHFFDEHYDRGLDWYCRNFDGVPPEILVGEKSTEYFDTATAEIVASRIAKDCPDTKVIIILREPVARTLSALRHMVSTGNEPLPQDPNALLFADRERPPGTGHRYIERGFYARQLAPFSRQLRYDQLLVLIFEEDIVAEPHQGLRRTLEFLDAARDDVRADTNAINARRLSQPAIRLMHAFRHVPYARSLIWRFDMRLPLKRWCPAFSADTRQRLQRIFLPENERLYELIGRRIAAWGRD